ncbi:hypothetical protein MACH24_15620 [Erythrobacter sp. Dej080120_24]|nr:hypothetical protein MACH24_15620 [Erythrobacter sp. Dej080120_24]
MRGTHRDWPFGTIKTITQMGDFARLTLNYGPDSRDKRQIACRFHRFAPAANIQLCKQARDVGFHRVG